MFFGNNLNDINHCFFSRLGGTSDKNYSSLNCGLGSSDSKSNIILNRKKIANYFSLNSNKLVTLNQTHSNKVAIIEKFDPKKKYNFDGVVTKEKNVILGILTADCAPILFYDGQKNIIGACHAGWKGALSGVISNTISAMTAIGSVKKNIKCSIGPCIGTSSYEVKTDFYKILVSHSIKNNEYFESIGQNKYLFSLRRFIVNQLKINGVDDVSSVKLDTYSNEDLFFSYRRSLQKKEGDYGRMISAIVIKH